MEEWRLRDTVGVDTRTFFFDLAPEIGVGGRGLADPPVGSAGTGDLLDEAGVGVAAGELV